MLAMVVIERIEHGNSHLAVWLLAEPVTMARE
jgi:hypothetical protein